MRERNMDKRIVEINGVKMEVDLRHAKRVDSFRVGDPVKVLVKQYTSYQSYFGMIVGFDEFKNLPTIIVAYINPSAYESAIQFVYINSETKDTEVVSHDPTDLGIEKADVLEQFNRQITKKEEEIRDLKRKQSYFLSRFGAFFEKAAAHQEA
jgi:hypothetical protein